MADQEQPAVHGASPDGEPAYRMRQALRSVLIGAMFGCVILLISGISVAATSGGMSWAITAVLAALLLLALSILHISLFYYLPTRQQYESGHQVVEIDYEILLDDTTVFRETLDLDQVTNFVDSLLNPQSIKARIIEEIHPLRRVLRQSVSTNINLPGVKSRTTLYPIMVPTKGELQDHLSIQLDGPIATLTYNEYLALVAKVISVLAAPVKALLDPTNCSNLENLEKQAFVVIARRGPVSTCELSADVKVLQSGLTDIAKYLDCEKYAAEREAVLLIGGLVEKLASNYAIIAVLKRGVDQTDKFVIKYERYLIPSLELATPKQVIPFVRDALRMLLGARPFHLQLPLTNAAVAQSYHLLVFGPDGMYAGWQQLTGTQGVFTAKNEANTMRTPYKRFRKRRGQRYVHLYMRSVPPGVAESLRLNMRFYEVPPGTIGRAAIAAIANFALVYMAGVVISANHGHTFGTDFPAVVLAFPAVAAILVEFDGQVRLLDGTLAARSSSLLTIASSLLASGLYMSQGAGYLELEVPFHVLAVNQLWWQLIVVTSLFSMLFTLYIWASRTASYYWLAGRADRYATGMMLK